MSAGALLAAAACATLVGVLCARGAERLWLVATVSSAAAGLAAAASVLSGGDWAWSGSPVVGGPLSLRLDGVSALFLALLCVIGAAGAVYSREYWSARAHPRSAGAGRVLWSGLLASVGFVLLTANGLHFLIGWELFTLFCYLLITLERRRADSQAAGWLYLAASHAGTLFLFAFFAALAARTGGFELGPMRDRADLAPLFWLALLGFSVKAGVFPFHVWLPSAHANAPSHVSAIMSGVTIKIGIYGLVRFSGWLPTPDGASTVVVLLGLASAVFGVAFALGQHDLKRLLAYHSVENIGIILIGLGFSLVAAENGGAAWGQLALAGALLHVWNHGLFKALLFFGAGSVLHATGTREMGRLGGLWRSMPWTTALFALGAAAISGVPPLNGFVSEWLVALGLFDATLSRSPSAWAAIPGAILLGVTAALALACFVKACGVVFLGAARSSDAARAHESGWAMRGPMLALAAACTAIGLAPLAFWPAIARAVGSWRADAGALETPASLRSLGFAHAALAAAAVGAAAWLWRRARRRGITRAVTWDCGYVAPSPRMQYTPGSFAAILTEWFGFVLRPERREHGPEGVFPAGAARSERTPETVLERVVEPTGRVILRVASAVRRLQRGRVQSYVLYVLVGVAAIALVVVLSARS